MAAEAITLDDLLGALRDAGLDGPVQGEGRTRTELKAAWGCGERTARKYLDMAQQANILRIGRRVTVNLAGVPCSVPVYSFVIGKPKKGRKS